MAELRTARVGRHEIVIALRSTGCFARRVVPIDVDQEVKQNQRSLPARGGKYQAEPGASGLLDDVVFRQQSLSKLGADEIGIAIHAAGLNFKDVMITMGLLGDRAASGGLTGRNLGLEVSGRVMEVGQDVSGIQCGDQVMGRVSNGIAGYAVAKQDLVLPIPSSLSVAQAASVQTTFFTAYYGLVYLARLTAGETVLIHSAAGGVGSAAIQIAKLVEARVYARNTFSTSRGSCHGS